MSNPGRTLFGVLLLLAGVLFLLDLGDVINAGNVIGTWWPVVIIAFGVLSLVSTTRSVIGGSILIGLGAILLLATLDVLPISAGELFLPLILIAVGGGLLFIRASGRGHGDPNNSVSAFTAFGGQEIVSRADAFTGGSLSAMFGGVKLDLRNAMLAPDGAGIEVFSAFGGVEIIVPPGWRVTISGMPLFGAIEDKLDRTAVLADDAPMLRISGVVMFGGLDVKQKVN